MKRTTVMLPLELKARAACRARERGISLGEFVRRSLEAALEEPATAVAYDDPLFVDGAVYEGDTPEDLAAAHDGYLYGNDG